MNRPLVRKISMIRYAIVAFVFSMIIFIFSISAKATTLEPVDGNDNSVQVTVGTDADGNTTVSYNNHVFTRKYNGWYVPAAYIYDGTDLAVYLDAKVAFTRRTSTRHDGFLFVKMSGGWYRHELHINDGRALANVFNEAAGITSTYNPYGNPVLYDLPIPSGQPEATP